MKTRKSKPEKRQEGSGLRVRRVNLLDRPPPADAKRAPLGADLADSKTERTRRSSDGRHEIIIGLPLPALKRRGPYSALSELEVGECMVVERDNKYPPTNLAKWARKLNRTFAARRLPPPRKGWGIWRVE